MLSAEELSAGISKNQSQADPPKKGQKLNTSSCSWFEENEVERCRSNAFSMLSAQRIEKKSLRSVAEWISEKGMAMVTRKYGRFWSIFGIEHDKLLWLSPEEALFLMEMNLLDLTHGGVLLSVQHAHNLILSAWLTLTDYQVYSKLQRLGWIVLPHRNQHPDPPSLVPAQPPVEVEVIDLDDEEPKFKAFDLYVPDILNRNQFVVRVAPGHLYPPNLCPSQREYLLRFGGGGNNFQPQQNPQDPRYPGRPSPYFRRGPPPFNSQIFNQQRFLQGQHHITFHMQQTQFRGNFFQAQRWELRVQGMPHNLMQQQQFRPRQPNFRSKCHQQNCRPSNRHRDLIPHYQKSDGSISRGSFRKRKIESKSWSELKSKEGTIETITLEPDEEVGKLNECCLLQPEDCKSYKKVLKKLQIFHDGDSLLKNKSSRSLSLKYDVFAPSSNFRKSSPGSPFCHIVILCNSEDVPNEVELRDLEDGREVQIVFAVVLPDSIQFISLKNVDLQLGS